MSSGSKKLILPVVPTSIDRTASPFGPLPTNHVMSVIMPYSFYCRPVDGNPESPFIALPPWVMI